MNIIVYIIHKNASLQTARILNITVNVLIAALVCMRLRLEKLANFAEFLARFPVMCFFETSWKTCLVMCPAPSRTDQGWTTARCHRSNMLFKYFLRENSSHSPSINSLFCSLASAYTLLHWSLGRSLSTAKLADSRIPSFVTQTCQSYAEIFT